MIQSKKLNSHSIPSHLKLKSKRKMLMLRHHHFHQMWYSWGNLNKLKTNVYYRDQVIE